MLGSGSRCPLRVAQPCRDIGISSQRIGIERAFHDSAIGMAADDYLRHPQHAHRIFDRRRNAADRIRVGRHNIADHAADEQVAGFGLGEQARVDAGVGAGDEQRFRPLAERQLFKEILMPRVNIFLKSGDAPQKLFYRHIVKVPISASGRSMLKTRRRLLLIALSLPAIIWGSAGRQRMARPEPSP